VFTSLLAGDYLTTNSVLLCYDLQQWGSSASTGGDWLSLGLSRTVDFRARALLGSRLTQLYSDSPDMSSARTQQETPLPTIALLSGDVTADVDVTCSSVACKRGRGHVTWWLWKCVYRAIASQRPSLLIKLFRISADMPQY
jgi:hypothetical protein